MSTELTRAQTWVYGQLTSSGILLGLVGDRIGELPMPQDTVTPFVVYDYRGGADQTLRGTRYVTTLYWGVVAVGLGVSTLRLQAIADAIDDALTGQSGQVESVIIDTCERVQTLQGVGFQSGDDRRYLGGLYKLTARLLAV